MVLFSKFTSTQLNSILASKLNHLNQILKCQKLFKLVKIYSMESRKKQSREYAPTLVEHSSATRHIFKDSNSILIF